MVFSQSLLAIWCTVIHEWSLTLIFCDAMEPKKKKTSIDHHFGGGGVIRLGGCADDVL